MYLNNKIRTYSSDLSNVICYHWTILIYIILYFNKKIYNLFIKFKYGVVHISMCI
jgi:hypothetical protein